MTLSVPTARKEKYPIPTASPRQKKILTHNSYNSVGE